MKSKSKPIAEFNPTELASRLSVAIQKDLSTVSQEYSVDPSSVRFTELVYEQTLLKKFGWDSDEEILQADAFAAFRARMSHMRRHNHFLVRLRNQPSLDPSLCRALNRAQLLAKFILGVLDTEEWFKGCRHSAGVTLGTEFRDTSLEAKFSFPLTTTKAVIPLFSEYLSWDSHLGEALFWANLDKTQVFDIVEWSRATSVPKQQDKCRMIAIEPTLNMFFQQGLMNCMYDLLCKAGLDVTTLPDKHKKLAWLGSITHSVATIDFSSASDCVITELVRWILPPDWCSAVLTVRSPSISLNGQVMELPIVSTMGNATTFPLETLIFYCLAVASVMEPEEPYNGCWKTNPNRLVSDDIDRSKVSVFGDDCILPTSSARVFMTWCTSLGFTVNEEKSFYGQEGFRESCGGDYYHGRSVRGLYITSPSTNKGSALAPWLYGLFNRIRTKYITYFGPRDWLYDKAALRLIFDELRRAGLLIRLVPSYMPEDSGIQSIDVERLLLCYSMKLACVKSNPRTGVCRFTYHAFRYWKKFELNDGLRYWDKLRNMHLQRNTGVVRSTKWPTPDDPFSMRTDRQKGGYYVASGFTTVW